MIIEFLQTQYNHSLGNTVLTSMFIYQSDQFRMNGLYKWNL